MESKKDLARHDYSDLFDMSTVIGIDPKQPSRIRKEVVKYPKLVMQGNSASIVEEDIVSYFEDDDYGEHPPRFSHSRSDGNLLRLNYSRGCGKDERDTDHFVMPSLRLEYMDDHEYQEPTRDRDKDWILDSQRDILNKEPSPAKNELKLGQHKKPTKHPPLMWSPMLQTAVRKRRLLRIAAVISDTHCFVDIFGLGVAGRLLAPGGPTSRLLLVEAYSVWDSTTYSITIHIPHLKRLLLGKEYLFKPGKKRELLKELVHLLYFDYTIEYKTLVSQEDVSVVAAEQTDVVDSVDEEEGYADSAGDLLEMEIEGEAEVNPSTNGSATVDFEGASEGKEKESCALDGIEERLQQPQPEDTDESDGNYIHHTLEVSHLSKFKLPENYPQTIADIIRSLTLDDSLLDTLRPKLTQTLRISPIVRENGPVVRRRDAVEKFRLEQEEIKRKRQAWLAIPRRRKGLLSGKCVRKHGKFIVMMCYRMPTRPSVLSIQGHAMFECGKLFHNLDLGSLGQQYGVKLSPKIWGDDIAKFVGVRSARLLSAGEMRSIRNAIFLTYPGKAGSDTQLCDLPSCKGFELRRCVAVPRKMAFPGLDGYVPDLPLTDEPVGYVRSTAAFAASSCRKHRLYAGDPITGRCKPRRDVGRPNIKLLTKVKKIGHVYGICTFYLISKLNCEELPTREEMEESIANKVYGNQVLPNSIGPGIRIMIEIYFSENPTFTARRNGDGLDFGEEVKNSPKVYRIELSRGDICRLIDNKEILRTAFRVGHKSFIEDSSPEEALLMENTWGRVACCLLGKLRWRKPTLGRYGAGVQAINAGHAADILAVDFADVTDYLIGRSADKIKAPSIKMSVCKDSMVSSDAYAHLKILPRVVKVERFQEIDYANMEFVLSFPTVLFSRTCPLLSEVETRLEVNMQVVVWQLGAALGVICYDRQQREVHILQPSEAQQDLLCEQAEISGPEEISINLSLFASSLVYQEEMIKGTLVRTVIFGDLVEEGDNPNFVNDDYGAQAVEASKAAAEAARARQRAGVGEKVEAEEPEEKDLDEFDGIDDMSGLDDDMQDIDDMSV